MTRLWVDLSLLNRKVWDTLFVSRGHVREIIDNGSYIGLLYILAPSLKEWKEAFEGSQGVPSCFRSDIWSTLIKTQYRSQCE